MRRLPDTDNFLQRLRNDELTPELLTRVAQRLSEFHENAERSDKTRSFGEFEVVSQNALENFEQTHAHRGLTVSAPLHSRLEQRTRDQLQELRPLIEQRASQGRPCDTHGDLRLDHIYWTPGETHELPIIDCIEFNQRFRYADPLADGAFLAMDLELEATPELAQHFAHAFLDASGESDSAEQLFRFYVAYRAVVRAKVDGFKAQEPEVPVDQRQAATRAATAHWLLAARLLSEPQHAPALVLVGGLPGTGKSTLSRQLAEAAGFTVIRSDVVRKQLLDLQPTDSKRADFGEGIYSAEHTQRTYDECWNRAAELLRLGQRVIVDASFTRSAHRTRLADEAKSMGVRTLFLICQTPAATARRRITKRQGDPSDATPRVHTELQKQWDAVADTLPHATLDTRHDPNATLQESLKALREYGLW